MELSMLDKVDRGLAILAVVQLCRWWAKMESLLPAPEHRVQLLEAKPKDNVTIIHKSRL